MFPGQSSEFTDRSDSVRQRIGRPDRLPRLRARAACLGLAILLGVGAVASGVVTHSTARMDTSCSRVSNETGGRYGYTAVSLPWLSKMRPSRRTMRS